MKCLEVDFLKTSHDISARHFKEMFWFKKSTKTFHNWNIYPDVWDIHLPFQYCQMSQKRFGWEQDISCTFVWLGHLDSWNVWPKHPETILRNQPLLELSLRDKTYKEKLIQPRYAILISMDGNPELHMLWKTAEDKFRYGYIGCNRISLITVVLWWNNVGPVERQFTIWCIRVWQSITSYSKRSLS